MRSCQITGIPQEVWLAFRRMCLEQNISANRKIRELIEAQVALADGEERRTIQPIGKSK